MRVDFRPKAFYGPRHFVEMTGIYSVKHGGRIIAGLWRAAKGGNAPSPARAATFEDAVRVYGLTADDLDERHFSLNVLAAVALLLSSLAAGVGLRSFIIAEGLQHVMAAATGLTFLPLLALAARFRFRAWQIEQRSLRPVAAWYGDSSEMVRCAKWIGAAALLWAGAAALFYIPAAWAQAATTKVDSTLLTQILNTTGTDRFILWLRQVFGVAAGGTETTAIAEVIGVLNASLFAVGLTIFAYIMSAGAVQTASDGEFLGRRFNAVWGPLRWGLAGTALVPVKGGFTLLQIAVITVAIWGVNLANVLWTAVTSETVRGRPIATVEVQSAAPMARDILENLICMNLVNRVAGVNAAYGQSASSIRAVRRDYTTAPHADFGPDFVDPDTMLDRPVEANDKPTAAPRVVTGFDGASGSGLPPAVCGSIDYSTLESGDLGIRTGTALSTVVRQTQGLNKAAVDLMIERLTPLAGDFAKQLSALSTAE